MRQELGRLMEVLVIFETVEGQTRKVVEFVELKIRAAGHGVQLFDAGDRMERLPLEGVDKIVLAAPIHERRHPIGFETLVSASREELNACQTLMMSISLKAAFSEGLEEAQDYLDEMKMRTGFIPDNEILVAGAVRTGSYDYYERLVVQNVALVGRDVELVGGVHEFTNWDQLHTEVQEFIHLRPKPA